MSRAKFEEWCKQERGMLCNDETQALMLSAWLAGRESMRDEAAKVCEDQAYLATEFDLKDEARWLDASAGYIRKIEP